MVRIAVPPYSPVGYKGQEEQEMLEWRHSTSTNKKKNTNIKSACAADADDVFDDHNPAGNGTAGSSSSSHPSFGPSPADHIILDAAAGAPPARGVRHHDDHHHDECSKIKEDENNNNERRQEQHHQIMDRDFLFSRGEEESRQDDDCLVDTRTTITSTVDETRSQYMLLQSSSSYETLSCLDRPREGGRRMKDSDCCLPSYEQIVTVSSSSTNFDSVDHHDDKRLEGGYGNYNMSCQEQELHLPCCPHLRCPSLLVTSTKTQCLIMERSALHAHAHFPTIRIRVSTVMPPQPRILYHSNPVKSCNKPGVLAIKSRMGVSSNATMMIFLLFF